MRLGRLAREMERTGVLGAGRFGRAVEIVTEMFRDKSYTNFLSMAGPIVPAGLRQVIRDLIADNYIHAIITSGANITHDIIESLGYRHVVTSPTADDEALKKRNLGRIYDIGIRMKSFETLEKRIHEILNQIPEAKRNNMPSYQLIWEIGKSLRPDSIAYTAQKEKVPIFSPGIYDSMLGLNLWTYSQLRKLVINPFLDFSRLVDMAYEAKRTGVIALGGGVPKHHALAANIFRGGLDAAVQITLDRPESGSASGAPLEEAISWGKIKSKKKLVTVVGDSTLVFPLLIAAVFDNLRKAR